MELQYVIGIPFFWQSLGIVTATAMFLGAILLKESVSILKSIIVILGHASLLLFVNVQRISSALANNPFVHISTDGRVNVLVAHVISYAIVTVAYCVGLILGAEIVLHCSKDHESGVIKHG